MLYYKNLHNKFFRDYPSEADRFIALSGYVGPEPIRELRELPFDSKIVYGLFKENPKRRLHEQLLTIHSEKTAVFYSEILCHSKCYIWLREERPVRGFIGSANFSSNGLWNDYRETLFEVDDSQLFPLKDYIDLICASAKVCTEYNVEDIPSREITLPVSGYLDVCHMVLYDPRTGQTQNTHGLNWGMGTGIHHTRKNDACIPIRADYIRSYPQLFPPKQAKIEGRKRQNEVIEIIWDDDTTMKGLLEGTNSVDDVVYPKQISSYPNKDEIGKYIRRRIGVAEGERVLREHLTRYGKDYVAVSLLEEGVYSFDFSS